MPARCETCHYWIPGERYVEGGEESQQSGLCKFEPQAVRNASHHWCGRWRVPTPAADSDTPKHLAGQIDRYKRDGGPSPADQLARLKAAIHAR
jgi:hypothetical protein